jgi:cell division protein FtsI (penicillin-binding protein 3)
VASQPGDKSVVIKSRAMLVAAILLLGFIGVGARLVYLQVFKHQMLYAKAIRQQQEIVELPPKRGAITDRNGRELAVSIDTDSLYAVPADIDDPKLLARLLAPALGQDRKAVEAKLTGKKRFVWLAKKVTPDVPEKVAAAGDFRDVLGWLPDSRRYYPKKELASHVLGFVGMENKGLEGIEAAYENFVGGIAGKAVTERDGTGKEILAVDEGNNSPKPGCNLILTIDEKIQYIVEKELDEVMAKYSPVSASAIVMDPRTGEILALANRPGYNPNNLKGISQANLRDRAVTDLYEPGSTFKIVTAAAALEEGVVKPSDIIDCGDGEIEVCGRVIHDAHKEGGHKTFAEVIQKSSNVGTIKVAMKLGQARLYKYATAFGFGRKTGVDLPGEVSGKLRELKYWSGMSLASVSIGQEVNVTPLQMLTALNCIANGGSYVRPYIVSRIASDGGEPIDRPERAAPRQVISKSTAAKLAAILSNVVEDGGTAVEARIRGWQVAGKTGTAQKFDPGLRRYSREKYIGSFVGFAPADEPRISAIVVVNEPRGQYYGGLVAAPAFKNIVEKTLTHMRVPTRLPEQTILVETGR